MVGNSYLGITSGLLVRLRSRHFVLSGGRGESRIMSEEFLGLIALGLLDLGYQNVADVMPIRDQF